MPKPTRDLKKGRTPPGRLPVGGGGSACNDHAVRDRCAARNDVIAEKQRAPFPAGATDTLSPATGAGCAPARTRGRHETRSQKDPAPGRIEISANLDTDSRTIRTVRIVATGHRRGADGAGGKGAQRRRPAGRVGRRHSGVSNAVRASPSALSSSPAERRRHGGESAALPRSVQRSFSSAARFTMPASGFVGGVPSAA